MNKVVVDAAQILAMIERIHQLLAHAYQRGGAPGSEIESAEEFLPARFGGDMHFGGGCVRRRRAPGIDGLFHPRLVDAEALRQRLEKCDPRADCKSAIPGENLAGERDTGGLATAGQQVLAQLDEAFRAGRRLAAPVTRKQRPSALRYRLQQFSEERGVHEGPMALPLG